jgi:hypothetical protein
LDDDPRRETRLASSYSFVTCAACSEDAAGIASEAAPAALNRAAGKAFTQHSALPALSSAMSAPGGFRQGQCRTIMAIAACANYFLSP